VSTRRELGFLTRLPEIDISLWRNDMLPWMPPVNDLTGICVRSEVAIVLVMNRSV
jgi:hypothetical protein